MRMFGCENGRVSKRRARANLAGLSRPWGAWWFCCVAVAFLSWVTAAQEPATNAPPTIRAVAPSGMLEGETIQLSATVVDPDSAPDFQYVWTFPDELRSTNPTPSLLVREPTPYPVGEVVVDQEGNPSVLYWHYLAITNVPPSILSVTPTSGAEGDTLAFSAIVADAGSPTRHHYEWTLPDATKSVERSPSYWFSQPGDYPLSLTVRELGLEYVYNNSRETGPRLMFYSDLRETGDESVVVGTNRVL